ncbi:putative ABC transporter, AAA+ ATPase domain, P-loop containing nucleoside triphosphate hydrolase [Helianthus anomalus]
MGKKRTDEGGEKSKRYGKEGNKEKLPVSVMLANMDQKPYKAKKVTKPKPPTNSQTYADIDLPPSDDDDDVEYLFEDHKAGISRKERANDRRNLEITVTDRELKKREKRVMMDDTAHAEEKAKRKDLDDPFTILIGSRAAAQGQDDVQASVKDITVENFSVSASGKELLKNVSIKISHGKRYGLVGPNGTGKSTLLKLLADRKIPVPKNIDVLLVEQEIAVDDRTALEAVVSANVELVNLRQQVATILKSPEGENGNRVEEVAELYEKLLVWALQKLCKPVRPGHYQEYLCGWKKTLVVVSHDRDFLNTVCTDIIHLHDLKLHMYRGNFDDFESGYEQRRKEVNKKFETYDKQVKAAKRAGNQKQQAKVKEKANLAVKEAKKKKSKGKGDEEEEIPEAPQRWRDYTVEFHFPEPTELTPPLLQLIEVGFSYPERDDFRLSDVDVGIDMGTRVAIVGPNGAGKSTLLNLLAGDLNPTEGEVRRSQKLRIGRYSQHFVDLLTMSETPVAYLLRLHPDQEGCSKQEAVRAKLGKFGLPSHSHLTPIDKLSGGQKARVVLTSISMSKPHILLLDEPTNHLDMQSIEALADALNKFTGGVVLVSHDARLLSRVCDDEETRQIWVVDNASVEEFDGGFEDYKEELLKLIRAERHASALHN